MSIRLVLLGPPASGKGTLGRLLADRLGVPCFSTGRQLRREVELDTEWGRQAQEFLAQGQFVPDALALSLVLAWLREAGAGWILDGFPRTLPQARDLDEAQPGLGERDGLRAALLEAPVDVLERRVAQRRECTRCSWGGTLTEAEDNGGRCPACGGELRARDDDALWNFRERHRAFDELTKPAADYYEQSGRLVRVDADGAPREVFDRLLRQLELD